MIYKLFLACVMVLALFANSFAGPPQTLQFENTRFTKSLQRLYPDPVKRVCLRKDNADAYPSAVVFSNKIIFLLKDGRETVRDTFPASKDIKITESAHGEYIYLFGPFGADIPGGFHRLYEANGKRIFARQDTAAIGTVGLGIPLERQKAFVMGGLGKVTLTAFDGQQLAVKALLDSANYEDGDIYAAAGPAESTIVVVANRFKVPTGTGNRFRPILYIFDSKLNEISNDTLDGLLALSISCADNGKYLVLREEIDNASPLWILDLAGLKLASFENPRVVSFASNADYLLNLPRTSKPEIVSTQNWRTYYSADLLSEFTWSDASISDDGALAALYNGNEIALVEIAKQSSSRVSFPYAFESCRFYGDRLILRGEFGFTIYKITR